MATCIIDCRTDGKLENDYISLNIWGYPVFSYVTEEVIQSKCFAFVYLLTNSDYVRFYADNRFGEQVQVIKTWEQIWRDKEEVAYFIVSGRAVMLKRETIKSALKAFEKRGNINSVKNQYSYSYTMNTSGTLYPSIVRKIKQVNTNVFLIVNSIDKVYRSVNAYLLNEEEALVINTKNDFELALILKKKELNTVVLLKSIQRRIIEKETILRNGMEHSVCLVGHSQIDEWDITELYGRKVRNCGICGISSFQYASMILNKGLLNCIADLFIVMHGTNDIIYNYTDMEIVDSILETITYIKEHNSTALVFFIPCLHVNGRADRSNQRINCLNKTLRQYIKEIQWIDIKSLDDEFGNLRQEFTRDGLHLSKKGYILLGKLVEEKLREVLG